MGSGSGLWIHKGKWGFWGGHERARKFSVWQCVAVCWSIWPFRIDDGRVPRGEGVFKL